MIEQPYREIYWHVLKYDMGIYIKGRMFVTLMRSYDGGHNMYGHLMKWTEYETYRIGVKE